MQHYQHIVLKINEGRSTDEGCQLVTLCEWVLNPQLSAKMLPSSSGQDDRFSTYKQGFNSPWEYYEAMAATIVTETIMYVCRLQSELGQGRMRPNAGLNPAHFTKKICAIGEADNHTTLAMLSHGFEARMCTRK